MNPMALVPGGEARRGRCLGPDLTAYADRAMDPSSLRQWDRHLVACTSCRAAVDDERRVLASLRSSSCASAVPGELRGMLLALAAAAGVSWLLNRSTTGFELRAVGANPAAARTAGRRPPPWTPASVAASWRPDR